MEGKFKSYKDEKTLILARLGNVLYEDNFEEMLKDMEERLHSKPYFVGDKRQRLIDDMERTAYIASLKANYKEKI